jgi:hypothetical protein
MITAAPYGRTRQQKLALARTRMMTDVGNLRQVRDGSWVERMPDGCPNGHPWRTGARSPGYLVGWDGTARIWTCNTCDAVVHGAPGSSA